MPFNSFTKQQTPFWIFTAGLLLVLTLPMLIQEGMFMDAMLYTSVSHNLSEGIGTFWFPQFSKHNIAQLPAFHEHPPLVFGIQALFFKLLGSTMYTERIYTLITLLVSAFIIIKIWNTVFLQQPEIKNISWLPVILWISIPVCFWSYSNNMQENTMGIFTLLSVLWTYQALHSKTFPFVQLLLSGVAIVFASLCKGIPGFFPIGVPLIFWVTTQKIPFKKAVLYSFVLLTIISIVFLVLFLMPESSKSLSTYLFKRALHRINEAPTVDSRFYIVSRLLMELLPQLAFVLIVYIVSKIKKLPNLLPDQFKLSLFFIVIGLSATAPLMLTMVQKGFYFVPALPFFGIGFAVIITPGITKAFQYLSGSKIFYGFSIILLTTSIVLSILNFGKVSRKQEWVHDTQIIGNIIPQHSVVSIPPELWNDWYLQCYLIRYYHISVEVECCNTFFIVDRASGLSAPPNYKKVDIATQKFDLYTTN